MSCTCKLVAQAGGRCYVISQALLLLTLTTTFWYNFCGSA
jgi:hypothetical protein